MSGLTYEELRNLNPCPESMTRVTKLMGGTKKWNGRKISAYEARAAGATFSDIVWAASAVAQNDKDVERKLRLWLSDCAARVLPIFEKEHPDDARPRQAIIAARRFARGETDAAAWDAAMDAARAAARAAAMDAARAAAMDAAWDDEERWQFDRLIARLESEPDDWPLSALAKETA